MDRGKHLVPGYSSKATVFKVGIDAVPKFWMLAKENEDKYEPYNIVHPHD